QLFPSRFDSRRDILVNEYSPTRPALKEAFCFQLIVDRIHCVPTDAKIRRHLTTGRQPVSRRVTLSQNSISQLSIELKLQRLASIKPNIINHNHWSYKKTQSGSFEGIRSDVK